MFNFPNDFLQDSFLLGLAIITVIVFGCKNVHTIHKTLLYPINSSQPPIYIPHQYSPHFWVFFDLLWVPYLIFDV